MGISFSPNDAFRRKRDISAGRKRQVDLPEKRVFSLRIRSPRRSPRVRVGVGVARVIAQEESRRDDTSRDSYRVYKRTMTRASASTSARGKCDYDYNGYKHSRAKWPRDVHVENASA